MRATGAGRVIMVEPAKMKKKAADDAGGDEAGGYKAKKAKELQKLAVGSCVRERVWVSSWP